MPNCYSLRIAQHLLAQLALAYEAGDINITLTKKEIAQPHDFVLGFVIGGHPEGGEANGGLYAWEVGVDLYEVEDEDEEEENA